MIALALCRPCGCMHCLTLVVAIEWQANTSCVCTPPPRPGHMHVCVLLTDLQVGEATPAVGQGTMQQVAWEADAQQRLQAAQLWRQRALQRQGAQVYGRDLAGAAAGEPVPGACAGIAAAVPAGIGPGGAHG